MRNPRTGAATIALLTVIGSVLLAANVDARVVLESRGPRYQRSPSSHELVLEGGLAAPAGDQKDGYWTSETGYDAGTGYQVGVRVRQFIGEGLSIGPAVHWVAFGAADGVGDFDGGGLLGYRLETSLVRYGMDLQMYLGDASDPARAFLTGGVALMHNRYQDELEAGGSYMTSINAPGVSAGAGVRFGNLEVAGEYTRNRFSTANLSGGRTDLDYNWDYFVVRAGFAFGR